MGTEDAKLKTSFHMLAYHSSFSNEQTEILEKYCIENKLLMFDESDYRGEKRLDRKTGIGYNGLNISIHF